MGLELELIDIFSRLITYNLVHILLDNEMK